MPPLPEQHRIVAAIESYFTRLDDAVATLERVQRNLKRYRASVLKAAVEGRLVPTEAELARAEGRDYEPASVLLERILAERRRRWEEAELAKLKAKGKTPKDDKWKAKYTEPVAPDTSDCRSCRRGGAGQLSRPCSTARSIDGVHKPSQRAPSVLRRSDTSSKRHLDLSRLAIGLEEPDARTRRRPMHRRLRSVETNQQRARPLISDVVRSLSPVRS